ncbi:hypothetical protein QE441_003825 [Chryseobacterium sp. SORGH_AS909]|uniref:hypothetical protein n=1 Tax=Chryseobacterium sp. SORGH_AS_0909 TaxID=3041759 RepID=UPI0028606943|nr:hypothetical protein [Chryseobacterium sp. SORGH_AS_0909]MDR6088031.1 hypothetical protein [Chryseobacterium sp. SORGH_AS_0909]
MNIISIRKNPDYKDKAIQYFQDSWGPKYPLSFMKTASPIALMQNRHYLNGTC